MKKNYTKKCYDDNPHYRFHYTYEPQPLCSTPAHLHYDSSIVLTYYLKGEGVLRVEGQLYHIKAGDLIILNPNEIHINTVDTSMPHERMSLYINNSILDSFNCKEHNFFDVFYKRTPGTLNLIPGDVVHSYDIHKQLNKILKLHESRSTENTVLIICAIIELLSLLNQTTTEPAWNDFVAPISNEQINAVIKYLSENYNQKINLDELAAQFHFSQHHLSRMFKQYTGATIVEYCTHKRLIAFNQLVCQNHSLESACYQVGFHNYSNFFRLYKKYTGITPSEYKRRLSDDLNKT